MALPDKLVQINKLKLELDELLPMSVENERTFWKKIRLDWNFNSNHIEGNTLTYGETQLLLIFDKTTGDHELREYEEMRAHDVAIHMIKEWAKDKSRDINEMDIRELNKTILVQAYWKDAVTPDGQSTRRQIKVGEYKEYPNSVRLKNGEIFEYVSPLETPQKMADLMNWYRNNDIQHPLVLASQLHYDFIRVHPFDDGNGRVARLLVNYVLMKNDYPPIIVKTAEKEKYLTALNKADVGDLNTFHEYMADELIFSLELAIKAVKGESIEEEDDYIKEIRELKHRTHEAKFPKTPGLVYEVFEKIKRDVWPKIETMLKNFDELFTESKTTHLVDSMDEEYGTVNVFASPFIKSAKPKGKEIFGYGVYERDINNVEWYHVKYGLKKAKKNTKYEIKFRIEYFIENYSLKISVNYQEVFKVLKGYNDLFIANDLEEMKKMLQVYLLNDIKKNMNE